MKIKCVALLTFIFALTGCIVINRATVFVRFSTIDSASNHLKLNFNFEELASDKSAFVNGITVLKNDSVLYKLESLSGKRITSWSFPAMPEGFKITYPENVNELRQFTKKEELTFEFKGPDYHVYYDGFSYKPQYATKDYRWLFDQAGNFKVNINCDYEPWLGKDIIRIVANEDFSITDNTFTLTDAIGNPIPFELKYKRNPTNKMAMVLKKAIRKDEVIIVAFISKEGNKFESKIVVPDKSVIGIAGKYHDL